MKLWPELKPFCLSEAREPSAAGYWAHLEPLVKHSRQRHLAIPFFPQPVPDLDRDQRTSILTPRDGAVILQHPPGESGLAFSVASEMAGYFNACQTSNSASGAKVGARSRSRLNLTADMHGAAELGTSGAGSDAAA